MMYRLTIKVEAIGSRIPLAARMEDVELTAVCVQQQDPFEVLSRALAASKRMPSNDD